jgi:hypothetical protein
LVAVRLRPHRWRDRRRRRTPRKMPGSQAHYSRLAIETALTLRTVFKVALRQSEGHLCASMRPRSPRCETRSSPVFQEMSVRPSLVRNTAVSGQDVGSFGSDDNLKMARWREFLRAQLSHSVSIIAIALPIFATPFVARPTLVAVLMVIAVPPVYSIRTTSGGPMPPCPKWQSAGAPCQEPGSRRDPAEASDRLRHRAAAGKVQNAVGGVKDTLKGK